MFGGEQADTFVFYESDNGALFEIKDYRSSEGDSLYFVGATQIGALTGDPVVGGVLFSFNITWDSGNVDSYSILSQDNGISIQASASPPAYDLA